MSALSLHSKAQWSADKIESFLINQTIPIHLSCNSDNGFPLICSLWYHYDNGHIWCATHENATVAKRLAADGKCAFEVTPDHMPYCGVRGRGTVELHRRDAEQVLSNLIDRYQIKRESHLAKWLMSRKDHEYAIKIKPIFVTAWDFTQKMSA